jgi:hypothetical protein
MLAKTISFVKIKNPVVAGSGVEDMTENNKQE